MLKSASDWDGGWASIVVASQTLSLPSLDDCVVLVWIKTRAGRAGVYLKVIVTCVINFGIHVINFGILCKQCDIVMYSLYGC